MEAAAMADSQQLFTLEMAAIAGIQYLFKLTCAVSAVVAMNYTLRFLNRATGNKFDETLAEASPNVRLGYFGFRLVGYAYIVGSILS